MVALGQPPTDFEFYPIGTHQHRADLSAVKTLTPLTGATKLQIQALDKNVRLTIDGQTNPTSTIGMQLLAGAPMQTILLNDKVEIRVIEEAATATIQYQWGA